MSFIPKDNSGALFVNDHKSTDNHPDRTGNIMVGGIEYRLSGWLRKTKECKPYLSLAVRPKDEQTPTSKPALDDEIPF